MKAAQTLLKHTPLIKFIGGPHKHAAHAATAHPLAPNGLRPSGGASATAFFNSNPIEPKEGEFFSRSQLPLRFRYKIPKEDEMDNITSGGAEVVF